MPSGKQRPQQQRRWNLIPRSRRRIFLFAQIPELHDWNWAEADKEYRLALKLNPNYAVAYMEYGRYLQALGRNDEAMPHVNYALKLNPFDYMTKDLAAWVIWASRQYDPAIKEFESLGDDLGLGGAAYRAKKMYPEAISASRWRAIRFSREQQVAFLGTCGGSPTRATRNCELMGTQYATCTQLEATTYGRPTRN